MRGVRAALSAAFAMGFVTGALAQSVKDPSGLALNPPQGYSAELVPNSGFTARIATYRQDDQNTACFVDFQGPLSGAIAKLTQPQLNTLNREIDHKEGMKGHFEARGTTEFIEHAGVTGAALDGNFTTAPTFASLLVAYYTTRGRTTVSCFTRPDDFAARRPEFLTVAQSITFPP